MSNTDLEDDLRGTFERAAASVPEADGLTERATVGARRAQRRTWIISGAAAAAVAAIAVAGKWRAVQMVGTRALREARPEDPVLVFKPDGTWTGSDGCNGLQGTYTIGQRGAFTATVGPQHLVGCQNVAHTGVLHAAKRIAVSGDTLQFFGADGRQLASYARAR